MLVHRVIRLLLAGQENILCLTFTNAAAHEIKERIFLMAQEWLRMPDHELEHELREICYQNASRELCYRARSLFFDVSKKLKVQTIHGFCKSLVSSFPAETGIAANFMVKELSEVLPKIFSQLLSNSSDVAEHLSQISCDVKESTLYELIYKIMSKPHQLEMPGKEPGVAAPVPDSLRCPEDILNALSDGGIRDRKTHAKLQAWNAAEKKTHPLLEEYLKTFICLDSLEKKDISGIVSKTALKNFPDVFQTISIEQDKLQVFADKYYTERISKRTAHILQIVRHCKKLYEYDKQTSKYLDYHDIINLALQLISDPDNRDWVLYCLDGQIDHLLVDESQDNSLEQWHIVAGLCSEFFSGLGSNTNLRTLFVVGDVKQSIYGFQNARPDYFHLMHQYFSRQSTNSVTIHLNDSYRSTLPILSLVDKVFNKLREQVSFKSEEISHTTKRGMEPGYVEIWPLLPTERRSKANLWDYFDSTIELHNNSGNSILLAQTIAQRILSWLENSRFLAAKNRPVTAGDILILIRHRSPFVDHMVSELKRVNIPVTGRDRFNIMDYVVSQDLVNLGEFLLLPTNDLALATLLKSPMFRYKDSTLLDIANSCTEIRPLWHKLQKFPECQQTAEYLTTMIDISRTHTALDLYSLILSQHRKQFVECLGAQSEEIMEEFLNCIVKFQYENLNTLESFIYWIKNTSPTVKGKTNASKDAVKIMTIHSAKGMQSPVVFLPDTTTIPRCDLQVVFDAQNRPFWCAGDTNFHCKQLKLLKKQEEYNEYLRLLYVAMTRAEDELYIAGLGNASSKSWYDIVVNVGQEIFEKKVATLQPMFSEPVDIMYVKS